MTRGQLAFYLLVIVACGFVVGHCLGTIMREMP